MSNDNNWNDGQDLTRGKIRKQLWSLGWPNWGIEMRNEIFSPALSIFCSANDYMVEQQTYHQ